MITDRDKLILMHIEEYDAITISQCERLFFQKQKYSYDVARKRLKSLQSSDILRVYRDKATNQNVYYVDKKLSYHGLLVMDYYSYLVSLGCQIELFKREARFLDGKLRADAFCMFTFQKKPYFHLLEVVTSNNGLNLEKYIPLYESGELQKMCKGEFPQIILVDNLWHKKKPQLDNMDVIQIDFDFSDVAKILLKK